MIGMIIEILRWIGIVVLVVLVLGIVLAVVLFAIAVIQVLREPDGYVMTACTLDDTVCDAPEGTPCSCCSKYQYYNKK